MFLASYMLAFENAFHLGIGEVVSAPLNHG